MLAEIFMVQLEAAARASQATTLQSNSHFVPFATSSQFAFKGSSDRFAEPAPAKAPIQHG
jgi:hypothetical protein